MIIIGAVGTYWNESLTQERCMMINIYICINASIPIYIYLSIHLNTYRYRYRHRYRCGYRDTHTYTHTFTYAYTYIIHNMKYDIYIYVCTYHILFVIYAYIHS